MWKKKSWCQKNKSEDSKMLTEKLQMLGEFCLGRPSLWHSPCIVQACCLWTGRVLKQHQLSKNQIKALSRCAKGQLEEGLHFFGSDSRNLSWGAQRIPFTWDTLFESQTPGYDSSYAAQHNLSCWTWTNAFFISSTESGIELGLCVCVFFLTHKPKNKGPCVRSGVYGSQAPAASMPLLRDSSCWPDIAWLERKEATVLQPALFVHRLALPFPSRVFFNDNSRKKKVS